MAELRPLALACRIAGMGDGERPVRIWLTDDDVIELKRACYMAGHLPRDGRPDRFAGVPVSLCRYAAMSRVVYQNGVSVTWSEICA